MVKLTPRSIKPLIMAYNHSSSTMNVYNIKEILILISTPRMNAIIITLTHTQEHARANTQGYNYKRLTYTIVAFDPLFRTLNWGCVRVNIRL